jgi:hypothetical protein
MKNTSYVIVMPMLLALALIGYVLPWVRTPSSALTLGAYDLAEWASLNPIVRESAPYLWTSLALRLPLAAIGILMAANVKHQYHRLVGFGVVLFTGIALLPPLEFFTVYRDDINYRQQFFIAIATLIMGAIVLMLPKHMSRIKTYILAITAVMGTMATGTGLSQVLSLMHNLNQPVQIGISGLITMITLGFLAINYITKQSS